MEISLITKQIYHAKYWRKLVQNKIQWYTPSNSDGFFLFLDSNTLKLNDWVVFL